jgi:hypothetical protein
MGIWGGGYPRHDEMEQAVKRAPGAPPSYRLVYYVSKLRLLSADNSYKSTMYAARSYTNLLFCEGRANADWLWSVFSVRGTSRSVARESNGQLPYLQLSQAENKKRVGACRFHRHGILA